MREADQYTGSLQNRVSSFQIKLPKKLECLATQEENHGGRIWRNTSDIAQETQETQYSTNTSKASDYMLYKLGGSA